MDEPFRRFEWHVAKTYHWQHWLDEIGRRLTIPTDGLYGLETPSAVEHTWVQLHEEGRKTGPVVGPVLDSGIRFTYSPMSREHATLFRAFAEIDYTKLSEIGDFVEKYGLLGLPLQEQTLTVHRFGRTDHHFAVGESHLDWAREICLMREALRAVRTRTPEDDAQDLAAWNRVGLQPPYEERRRHLTWMFNVHLQHVQARMFFDGSSPSRLSFAPLTLLAAMWLQLALSVAGDKEFRACKNCRRLFEISTELTGYRKHREFCSESCKTKDYRKRRRTAIALHKRGTKLTEIAAKIETNKETVRRWIAAVKAANGD